MLARGLLALRSVSRVGWDSCQGSEFVYLTSRGSASFRRRGLTIVWILVSAGGWIGASVRIMF